jgi:hypothetical protein
LHTDLNLIVNIHVGMVLFLCFLLVMVPTVFLVQSQFSHPMVKYEMVGKLISSLGSETNRSSCFLRFCIFLSNLMLELW